MSRANDAGSRASMCSGRVTAPTFTSRMKTAEHCVWFLDIVTFSTNCTQCATKRRGFRAFIAWEEDPAIWDALSVPRDFKFDNQPDRRSNDQIDRYDHGCRRWRNCHRRRRSHRWERKLGVDARRLSHRQICKALRNFQPCITRAPAASIRSRSPLMTARSAMDAQVLDILKAANVIRRPFSSWE